ncbi:MAG TPA: NUDIX hydrolase [Rhizomicrobium sp.]|nr:NUDIX hydrolase [Rhizomicrobium sp.]
MSEPPSPRPVLGVAAVIWNDRQEVLLIRRTAEPRKGQWSLPGGKVEFGETLEEAVRREVREETGLEIALLGLAGMAEIISDASIGAAGLHYVLIDYSARVVSGEAKAASDAADATWFTRAAIADLALWEETRRMIAKSARDVWGD